MTNRNILFRAKRVDNGEWVEGDFTHDRENRAIIRRIFAQSLFMDENGNFSDAIYACSNYEVDPDTVSQFTGLYDDNGNKIFEGDIVKFIIKFCYTNIEREQIGVVEFNGGGFNPVRRAYDRGGTLLDYEVIGNKWDNPELLENKVVMFGDTLVDPKLSENNNE